MLNKFAKCICGGLLAVGIGSADAGVYTGSAGGGDALYVESFDTDPGDWTTASGGWQATGGNADGHINAARTGWYPTITPASSHAYAYTDFVANFGNEFRISYDIKLDTTNNQGITFRISGNLATNAVRWTKTLVPSSSPVDSWQTVSFDVDTTWTDTEAAANGWVRSDSSTVTSGAWTLAWTDDRGRDVATNWNASPANLGAANTTSIDNVRIQSLPIPEPGALAIGAAGAILLGLGRSKRVGS